MCSFFQVRNIGQTIQWFEGIGFTCTANNLIWEPDCELNWARLEWEGAGFMPGPNGRETISGSKDASLWFNVDSIDGIIEVLLTKGIQPDIEPEIFMEEKLLHLKILMALLYHFPAN
ncbi:MAG: hypothetical protein WDO71_01400 [Bacteroidota bacterium]